MSSVNSTHDPRNGMIRAENSRVPFGWTLSSNTTPGERCSWLTITRSAPFTTNVPCCGEQRKVPEIHFLLEDVRGPLFAFAEILVHDESKSRLQRSGERHVALHAFLDGVLRLADRVVHELERIVLVHVSDREDLLEYPLETHVLASRPRDRTAEDARTPRAALQGSAAWASVYPTSRRRLLDSFFIDVTNFCSPLEFE